MRKCISLLTAEDMKPSYSLAKLALEAEIRGIRRFKCKTINDNGWCLGSSCNLYPKRGFSCDSSSSERAHARLMPYSGRHIVGGASAPLTGSSEPVPPINQDKSANMRGVAKLGLEDPGISAEDKAYWGKLLNVKVRRIDEYDTEVHKI